MAFKYDKVIKKLERFQDLDKEKQLKLLKKVLMDEDYLSWQFDPGKDHQAYTTEMVNKFYQLLAYPAPLRVFPKLLDHYSKRDFSRSSIVVLNAILTFGLKSNADMVRDLQNEYHNNGSSVETKDMKARAEKYAERLDGLKAMIQKLAKPYLEDLSKETGLSKDMVYRTLIVVPDSKYLPKQRITVVTMNMLEDLYSEANITGFPARGHGVSWRPLMKELFGQENLGSVAVSILLEGVHNIDQYRGSKNLGAVRDCWDSLTAYALTELERSSDDIRKQMINLYLKKAENKISRRGDRPTDFRVNLLRLGREFSNLSRTVNMYQDTFSGLFKKARYGDSWDDRRDDDRDRRDHDRDRDRRDRDRDHRDDRPMKRRDDDDDDDEDETPRRKERDDGDEKPPFDIIKPITDLGGDMIDKIGKGAQSIADTISRIAGDDD